MYMYISDVIDTLVSKISLLTRIIVSVLFQNILLNKNRRKKQNKFFSMNFHRQLFVIGLLFLSIDIIYGKY
jgi:hypothetical protein